MVSRNKILTLAALAAPLMCLCLVGTYFLPPVYERVNWRVEEYWLRAQYWLNPPEAQVFVPQQAPLSVQVTVIGAAATPAPASPTPPASATPLAATQPPAASPTPLIPTATPAPLPPQVNLDGVRYENQHGRWNYCAPANLSMALSYWGWLNGRDVVGPILKPYEKDKNVMPYEMVDYVANQTQLKVIHRVGGDLTILKRFLAAGFPVLVEKGVFLHDISGVLSWMGHYQVVTGYDDAAGQFVTQDSYVKANLPVSYAEMTTGWRAFNYTYLVIYPPEKEPEVMAILGPDADPTVNFQRAAQAALDETAALQGQDQYFAWFNRGSSLVSLQQYHEAALAYDQAFQIYPSLPEADRPWRMLWYQTGPYFAYYNAARYQDLLDLATQTLDTMQGEKNLEESYYWRAMAEAALGDKAAAVDDLMLALKYHAGFGPALLELQTLNGQ